MRFFFPSAHTLPAPPPHAPPPARGHAVDASHRRQRRRREPNLLSRFSSLLLLPVTAHHTVRAATARLATGERPRRRRRPPSAIVYDHRRERRCRRCSTIPYREKERCATTLRLVTTVPATAIRSATIARPHSTVRTSESPAARLMKLVLGSGLSYEGEWGVLPDADMTQAHCKWRSGLQDITMAFTDTCT
ncbi:hypothetical protein DEO72_LG5g1166 [Vigna unguiculata]|uniref:Uncharacterized protein n=1 Tax=Vigna unguiculata TaxID=3917 RepID=A0A4D6LWP2_VIGUN|nr:hypothetical protein DEO72_LG5g1166 [Vigna unguiculata]